MRTSWFIPEITDQVQIPQQLLDLVVREAKLTLQPVRIHHDMVSSAAQGIGVLNEDEAIPLDPPERLLMCGVVESGALCRSARSQPRSDIHRVRMGCSERVPPPHCSLRSTDDSPSRVEVKPLPLGLMIRPAGLHAAALQVSFLWSGAAESARRVPTMTCGGG